VLFEQIQEAKARITQQSAAAPEIGIILGTGLGALAGEIQDKIEIPYEEIPHFPLSTVESHAGKLLLGRLSGKPVVAMQGRFHLYEGYSAKQVVFPVQVMKALGIHKLLLFSASGGIQRALFPGSLLVIEDHINLLGHNPLIGLNDERLGPRFTDLYNAYDKDLRSLALHTARELQIPLYSGVYAAMIGPCLETVAEYRFLERIGADCVGMSTVPEVIAARHAGVRVLAITVITDRCVPDCVQAANIQEIIQAAMDAEPKLTLLVKEILRRL
jgi:purine-nucleoside phosphorylase